MKKELIICIIVIGVVVIGNMLTQNYTKQSSKNINIQLSELKGEISKQEKDDERIKEKIDKIQTSWDDMQETLAFYIEHDELEKVETQLFLLKGQIEAKAYIDTFAEIEKCTFILEHIEDKTALDIKNIF